MNINRIGQFEDTYPTDFDSLQTSKADRQFEHRFDAKGRRVGWLLILLSLMFTIGLIWTGVWFFAS